MGWTSKGWSWDERWIRWLVSRAQPTPFVSRDTGSHMLHGSGEVRHVTFGQGGRVLERLSYDGGIWSSMLSGDLFKKAQIYAKLRSLVPDDV
jgi:hypothetical protein